MCWLHGSRAGPSSRRTRARSSSATAPRCSRPTPGSAGTTSPRGAWPAWWTSIRRWRSASSGSAARCQVRPREAASPRVGDAAGGPWAYRDRCRLATNGGIRMEAHEDELGPIDIVVIGYAPDSPMTGEAVPLLVDLVERGIIRVLDVLFVMKNEDGTFSGFDATDLTDKGVGDFAVFEGASSGLLGDEDAEKCADTIEPGSAAVMIVYENRWAAPFIAAVRRNGGEAIAFDRIPAQDVIDALDAVEAAGATTS